MVTMIAGNEFDTKSFTNTLNTSFHDLHLQEKREGRSQTFNRQKDKGSGRFQRKFPGKGRDAAHVADDEEYEDWDEEAYEGEELGEEEEDAAEVEDEPSDAGASQDEEVADAYTAYDQARAKLHQTQKTEDSSRPRAHSPLKKGRS